MNASSEQPPITSFLLRHGNVVETSWFTADELIITFRPQVTSPGVLRFMVDLISQCKPVAAARIDDHTIRLAF